jgi:hypothetical protein
MQGRIAWLDPYGGRPDILPPLSGMFSESQITFWTWLGWFIGQFSTLENVMQRTLWFYSGVDEPVAKALFSGIKIDASIQQIRFIISEKPLDDLSSKALDHALRQAADINKVRNDLLHHGAFFRDRRRGS